MQRWLGIAQLLAAGIAGGIGSGIIDVNPHTSVWLVGIIAAIQGMRQVVNNETPTDPKM